MKLWVEESLEISEESFNKLKPNNEISRVIMNVIRRRQFPGFYCITEETKTPYGGTFIQNKCYSDYNDEPLGEMTTLAFVLGDRFGLTLMQKSSEEQEFCDMGYNAADDKWARWDNYPFVIKWFDTEEEARVFDFYSI